MSQVLLNSQVILNELLRRFENSLKAGKVCRHAYESEFAKGGKIGKIGSTLQVRDPVRFTVADTAAISIQDVQEKYKTLTIDTQSHVAFQFSSQELTLNIDKFSEKYLDSAAVALANRVDVGLLTKIKGTCPNIVGTPGIVPDELKTYLQGKAALARNAAPDTEKFVVYNEAMEVEIVDALKGLYNASGEIGRQYTEGEMRRAAGLTWALDQNCRTHTVGTGAIAGLNVPVAGNGYVGSALPVAGAGNGGTLTVGDIFTIENVYAVNPVSGDKQSALRQFVVTSTFTALGDGTGTVNIYPAITTAAPYATVDAAPVTGAAISVVGTASQAYPRGIIAVPEAFVWATVPMEMPQGVHMSARQTDPDTGVSMRMVSQYNIATDIFATRVDILWGVAALRPEWGCQVAS